MPLFSSETSENLLGKFQRQICGEELEIKDKLKLQQLLAEALFTKDTPKGKKPQFEGSNFSVLLNKGSKKS